MDETSPISRREFLRMAALAGLGLAGEKYLSSVFKGPESVKAAETAGDWARRVVVYNFPEAGMDIGQLVSLLGNNLARLGYTEYPTQMMRKLIGGKGPVEQIKDIKRLVETGENLESIYRKRFDDSRMVRPDEFLRPDAEPIKVKSQIKNPTDLENRYIKFLEAVTNIVIDSRNFGSVPQIVVRRDTADNIADGHAYAASKLRPGVPDIEILIPEDFERRMSNESTAKFFLLGLLMHEMAHNVIASVDYGRWVSELSARELLQISEAATRLVAVNGEVFEQSIGNRLLGSSYRQSSEAIKVSTKVVDWISENSNIDVSKITNLAGFFWTVEGKALLGKLPWDLQSEVYSMVINIPEILAYAVSDRMCGELNVQGIEEVDQLVNLVINAGRGEIQDLGTLRSQIVQIAAEQNLAGYLPIHLRKL